MPPRSEPRTMPAQIADLYEKVRRLQDQVDRLENANTENAETEETEA